MVRVTLLQATPLFSLLITSILFFDPNPAAAQLGSTATPPEVASDRQFNSEICIQLGDSYLEAYYAQSKAHDLVDEQKQRIAEQEAQIEAMFFSYTQILFATRREYGKEGSPEAQVMLAMVEAMRIELEAMKVHLGTLEEAAANAEENWLSALALWQSWRCD